MSTNRSDLIEDVSSYYSGKLAAYGDTPRGVDWNGVESQQLRFNQLCRILDASRAGSIADFGCGYGALYDFLEQRFEGFEYFGIDASDEMIDSAQRRLQEKPNADFMVGSRLDQMFDHAIASGVFNVRVGRSNQDWLEYIEDTLDMLNSKVKNGFAFNCLTSYSDDEKMRPDLYYADPLYIFDLCKRRYAKNVALLHDYGLFEFTILVRKSD